MNCLVIEPVEKTVPAVTCRPLSLLERDPVLPGHHDHPAEANPFQPGQVFIESPADLTRHGPALLGGGPVRAGYVKDGEAEHGEQSPSG